MVISIQTICQKSAKLGSVFINALELSRSKNSVSMRMMISKLKD